jgi:Domain of unknown function (DUF4365)
MHRQLEYKPNLRFLFASRGEEKKGSKTCNAQLEPSFKFIGVTTKRISAAGTASAGVHHVGKVLASENCIFTPVPQENDIGNDAFIEFIIDQEATGCCIAAQIKSGVSYIRNGRFIIPADKNHFEYWSSLILPVVGIVYDPKTDSAGWVDITAYLKGITRNQNASSFTITVPKENLFDASHLEAFRTHFLSYRPHYGDDAYFAEALVAFAALDDEKRCAIGLRSLFTFHRERPETWYYLISCLRHFRRRPLLETLIVALCHIPGHPDIFWQPGNITSESNRKRAEAYIGALCSREDLIILLEAIDEEGIARGQIGQSVHAIVQIIRDREMLLESIARDSAVEGSIRYWAAVLFVSFRQFDDPASCIALVDRTSLSLSGHIQSTLLELRELLEKGEWIDFW